MACDWLEKRGEKQKAAFACGKEGNLGERHGRSTLINEGPCGEESGG